MLYVKICNVHRCCTSKFVMNIKICIDSVICFVRQNSTEEPPPVAEPRTIVVAGNVPSISNPFDQLRGHENMRTLNAILVPWLIAEFGNDFASWDHVDVATDMITHVVTKEQLGGYTQRTFAAIVEGRRVQQTAFTKFVLRQAGIFLSFLVSKLQTTCSCSLVNVRQGHHCPSQ